MTIEALVYEIREESLSREEARADVAEHLEAMGYQVTPLTYAVIDKYLSRYEQMAETLQREVSTQ